MADLAIYEAMNAHLSKELYASHLYLSMAAFCEAQNLSGFANWMKVQSEEERMHALKFYTYLNDRNRRVTLQGLEAPPADFPSIQAVFEQALAHEQEVSGMINELYARAGEARDFPSQAFLQWFVSEQVEEEKIATQIVETLAMIGDNKVALLMLDRELAQRSLASTARPATG
jgi:ferritin